MRLATAGYGSGGAKESDMAARAVSGDGWLRRRRPRACTWPPSRVARRCVHIACSPVHRILGDALASIALPNWRRCGPAVRNADVAATVGV